MEFLTGGLSPLNPDDLPVMLDRAAWYAEALAELGGSVLVVRPTPDAAAPVSPSWQRRRPQRSRSSRHAATTPRDRPPRPSPTRITRQRPRRRPGNPRPDAAPSRAPTGGCRPE